MSSAEGPVGPLWARTMLTHLRARSRSLFSSYKPCSQIQEVQEPILQLDLISSFIKPWNSMQVGRLLHCFTLLNRYFIKALFSGLVIRSIIEYFLFLFIKKQTENLYIINKARRNLNDKIFLRRAKAANISSFKMIKLQNVWIFFLVRHVQFLFLKDLSRDIYDLYAEYEREELEDRLPVSPSRVLLSPNKHSTLNINVGGTVRSKREQSHARPLKSSISLILI